MATTERWNGVSGNGASCDALWSPDPLKINFDVAVLGVLPDHVGLVVTDGGGSSTFTIEAFDANGAPLGSRQIVENDEAP